MAGPHTSAILLASQSRDTDRMTFVAVTSFMRWDTHEAWPPVRFIAHAIGRSVRQTQKCLRRLEASGELVVRPRTGATHVYTLSPPLLELAKRFANGEKGLWERLSTGGEYPCRPPAGPRHADEVHTRYEDARQEGTVEAVRPNRSSTVREQNSEAGSWKQVNTQKFAKDLAGLGIKTSPHDKYRLAELVRLGASVTDIANAVSVSSVSPAVSNAFAYGAQTLINRLAIGHEKAMQPAARVLWAEVPWQTVVANGEQLGVGTWNPVGSTEHFPAYKRRVTAAMRRAGLLDEEADEAAGTPQ